MVLVNLAWLWLVSFTAVTWNTGGFESAQDKRVLTTRNCGIAQGLHNQWILWTQMWTEKITKWSCHFNSSQGDVNMWLIPECILLARVETYIRYCVHSRVYTGYKCCGLHIHLQYKNVDRGKGKWFISNHVPHTQRFKKKLLQPIFCW